MASTSQGSGRKPSGKSATARKSRSSSSARNGRAGSTAAKKRAPSTTAKRRSPSRAKPASTNSSRNGAGVTGTIKQVAKTAKGPAVAVGAAAAGVAGGLVLRSRTRRRTVLGVPVPRSLGKDLSSLDVKSVAKFVGHASKQFAKTSKNVSKDLERAGDQAERIGKILD